MSNSSSTNRGASTASFIGSYKFYPPLPLANAITRARLLAELRDDLENLKRVLIPTPVGPQIPLASVTTLEYTRGPPVIKSEDARPNAWIYVDLKTSDIGT